MNNNEIIIVVVICCVLFVALVVVLGWFLISSCDTIFGFNETDHLLLTREAMMTANELEWQERWRRERLHEIILLLLERKIVFEGIPLTAQLPNDGAEEVLCIEVDQHTTTIEEMSKPYWENVSEAENVPDEVKQRVRIILSMTIPYLLANGRPPEALEAPDILHLLLLRQQQAHDMANGDDLFDSDFDDVEEDESNNNEHHHHHHHQPEWIVMDANNWVEIEPEESTSPLSMNQTMSEGENGCHDTDPLLLSHEMSTFSLHGADYDNPWSDPARQSTTIDESGIRTETREMRKAAAVARRIKEAQVPQHRRRKTAEEVYGVGLEYTHNPLNEEATNDYTTLIVKRKDSTCTHHSNDVNIHTSKNKLSIALPPNYKNNNVNLTNNKNYLTNATTNATEVIVESCNLNNVLEMPQPPSQEDNNHSSCSLVYSSPSSSIAAKRQNASNEKHTISNAECSKCDITEPVTNAENHFLQ